MIAVANDNARADRSRWIYEAWTNLIVGAWLILVLDHELTRWAKAVRHGG